MNTAGSDMMYRETYNTLHSQAQTVLLSPAPVSKHVAKAHRAQTALSLFQSVLQTLSIYYTSSYLFLLLLLSLEGSGGRGVVLHPQEFRGLTQTSSGSPGLLSPLGLAWPGPGIERRAMLCK